MTFDEALSELRARAEEETLVPGAFALALAEEIERLRGIVEVNPNLGRDIGRYVFADDAPMSPGNMPYTATKTGITFGPYSEWVLRGNPADAEAIRNAPDEKIVMWMDVTEEITFFDAVSAKAHNFVESTGALRSRACWQSKQHDAVQVEVYETADSPTLFSVFVHRSESPGVVVERLRAGISKWLYGPAPESATDEADLLALPPGNVVHPAPPMSSTIESYKCLCLRVHTIPLLQRTFQCPCGESHVRDEGGVWRLATPESEGDALLRFFKGEE